MIADGGSTGRADPAFAAHEAPIAKWAEAVWDMWLPRAALAKLTATACKTLANRGGGDCFYLAQEQLTDLEHVAARRSTPGVSARPPAEIDRSRRVLVQPQ